MINNNTANQTPSHTPNIVWTPEKVSLPTNSPAGMSFLVEIEVPDHPASTVRSFPDKGLNLALVLDCSGSMGTHSRMARARQAANEVISQLRDEDRVSLVTFSDTVTVLASGVPGSNQEQLHAMIQGIQTGGPTNLHSGWLTGAQEVAKHFTRGALNRVVLLSDGMANRGVTQATLILEHVAALNRTGISTTTVGVGLGFNENLLQGIAEAGDGNYHFAEKAETLLTMFAAELSEQRQIFGTQVVLRFCKAPGVLVQPPLNDLPTTKKGRFKLGNLVHGKTHKIVFDAILPPHSLMEPAIEVLIEWRDVHDELKELTIPISLPRIADNDYEDLDSATKVMLERGLLQCATLKREAAEALSFGLIDRAQMLLNHALEILQPFNGDENAGRMMRSIHWQRQQVRRGELESTIKSLKHESSRQRRKSEQS